MKRLIENYTFNPASKQIIITDNENITQEKLLLITNMTYGVIVYNFADSAVKGSISGNIITLNYDTTSMSDSDVLQIWVEDTNPLIVTLCNCFNVIKHAVGRFNFDTSNQIRAAVSTITTVTTVTTANTGLGDIGKPATAILKTKEAFQNSIGKNFLRS